MAFTDKVPHTPQKMNILGRKRYSDHAGVTDVINFSFDDCWRAIGRLYGISFLSLIIIGLITKAIVNKD
ncbi:hypothetical protein [Eisenbergiella tayi]|uniref:Uncharacterized protein n=1 Tax=Eisenbergiella tayi TaxID=1432052 RepID=A0A1E3A3I9_9FIRM|nr:hypothetical protein [Eisenbergiella tayi]ODM03179.1 hypothetical protein BEI61_03973 [Eisenbergiella tayi]